MLSRIPVIFWQNLLDAAPWFAGGSLLGAAAQSWLKPEWVTRWLGEGRRGVWNAVLAGSLLPGCAMTTMPLAVGLKAKGVPRGTLTAFIMIAPILSPHTVILTFAMLGWKMAVGRILLPILMSLGIGWFLNALTTLPKVRSKSVLLRLQPAEPATMSCGCEGSCEGKMPGNPFAVSLREILNTLVPYFLGGLAVASALQAFLSPDFFQRHLQAGWLAYVAAAGAGIPLYVCEGAEVPLTASLLKLGLGSGPAFTFLLASVGTCLPTIAMAPRLIGISATVLYVTAWLLLAVGGGIVLSLF